jgi:putative hydroxymethylpyrimidine transport system ATP-binding protein
MTFSNCHLKFDHHTIFEDFHFDLSPGQWTCILGKSGVGKSSLLKILAGLVQPNQIQRYTPLEASYLPQQDCLMPWMSVWENVFLGQKLREGRNPPCAPLFLRGGHSKRFEKRKDLTHSASALNSMTMGATPPPTEAYTNGEKKEKALHLLERVGLTHAKHLKPAALSGGMRQRVALVRTLMEDKPVILMDEPFAALDIPTRLELHDLIAPLLKGKTVLLVTHDPLDAVRLADKIQFLNGAPAELSVPIEIHEPKPRDLEHPPITEIYMQLLKGLTCQTPQV